MAVAKGLNFINGSRPHNVRYQGVCGGGKEEEKMKLKIRLVKEEQPTEEISLEIGGQYYGFGDIRLSIQGLDGCLIFDPFEWAGLMAAGERALLGERLLWT